MILNFVMFEEGVFLANHNHFYLLLQDQKYYFKNDHIFKKYKKYL
jgi:hypothetical protein